MSTENKTENKHRLLVLIRVANGSDGPAGRVRKCTNMSGFGRVQFDLMISLILYI